MDTDADGLSDLLERGLGSDATNPDTDGDGRIDRYWNGKWSTQPGGLPADDKFAVSLNACELVAGSSIRIEQVVDGALIGQGCVIEARLAEGPHEWSVRLPGRGEVSRVIDVVHHLVVGLGDSYGSGEGADDTFGTSAGWQDRNCHRAANSAQARTGQEARTINDAVVRRIEKKITPIFQFLCQFQGLTVSGVFRRTVDAAGQNQRGAGFGDAALQVDQGRQQAGAPVGQTLYLLSKGRPQVEGFALYQGTYLCVGVTV